ncbi:hypothetical protein FB451DRAFT_1403978 [Mycena latifolia]|nr:hypothetical protein FB451DRAFT_1403978 [Mycena latifolia]
MTTNITFTTPVSGNGTATVTQTVQISDWFRGCVLWPESAINPCCAQVNSTATTVNGTFGCPYTSVFGATNDSLAPLDKCCQDGVGSCHWSYCSSFLGLDSPFPGSSSSPAPSPTGSASPTGSGRSNAAGRKGYSMVFLGILVLSLATLHGGV